MRDKTFWPGVWVAFSAGCIGATHIGKVAVALSIVITDLKLSLFEASLIISLFSLMTALMAAGFGLLADRVGHLYLAICGLAMCGVGSLLGAESSGFNHLLLSRLLEGMGFVLAIVSLPSLMAASVTDRQRSLVMGIWGAFMPVGIGMAMLSTPMLLEWQEWRGVWTDLGWLTLSWCVVMYLVFHHRHSHGSESRKMGEMLQSLRNPGPWLVCAAFACYSALFVPLTSFFPTMLVSEFNTTLELAAKLGAIVVLGNALGNVVGGWLIGHGLGPSRVIMTAFIGMGLCALLVYNSGVNALIKTIAGCCFSLFGGLVPGSAFALGARYALRPTHMALIAGLLLQGAGVGQVLGPMAVSRIVESFNGWDAASFAVIGFAIMGISFGWLLRRQN